MVLFRKHLERTPASKSSLGAFTGDEKVQSIPYLYAAGPVIYLAPQSQDMVCT